MPHTKNIRAKSAKKPAAVQARPEEDESEGVIAAPAKNDKKLLDFEEDAAVPVVADKLEDGEVVEGEVVEDEADDVEAGIDAEEIDPFGDKFEE